MTVSFTPRRWFESPAVLLFALSFMMPALVGAHDNWYFGAFVFLLGAINFWVNITDFDFPQGMLTSLCWLGNFTFLFSLYYNRKNKKLLTILMAGLSLVLMLVILMVDAASFEGVPNNSNGKYRINWSVLHVGYYLWVLSPLALLLDIYTQNNKTQV